jgi:hypothetical protein
MGCADRRHSGNGVCVDAVGYCRKPHTSKDGRGTFRPRARGALRRQNWKWKTGAGRFVEADHSFVAWAESKKTESFAEGHWEATDDGRLCMIATWTNRDGAQDNRTCFVHLRRWYIFKNYLNKPDDEFRKLSQVDSVSAKAERLKKSLEK